MKFRRFLAILFCLALTISASALLIGCGGSGSEGTENEGGGNEGGGETATGLTLVESGNPTFQFVYAIDVSDNVKTIANKTLNTINKALNSDADIVTESKKNAQDVEIIFGTPSYRGDEYAVDFHYLGPEGYAVKVVGTKVLVLFGSDNAATAAIEHVKGTLFGITNKTKKLSEVVATSDKLIESPQTFTLTSATVAGNDLKGYVLEYPTALREQAQDLQNKLYIGVGIWLPKGEASESQKAVIIREIENRGEGSTDKGYKVYVDADQNLIIETEFANKLPDANSAFLKATILASGKTEMSYADNYTYYEYDARNIYYEDFGAKGNGTTDDFEAIKKCHEYANQYGHTVNGNPTSTYRIGKNDAGTSAIIKTDVNWNGCTFIFDDRDIQQPIKASESSDGQSIKADKGYNIPIFSVESDKKMVTLEGSNIRISTLEAGAENVGFAVGYKALIVVYNSNVKHYIRYGANADAGQPQHEIILIDENGNVDPSTPVQWDYSAITKIELYRADDTPITISGGEYNEELGIDNRAHITTRYNQGRSLYTYFERNITITRSNVVIENVTHEITDYKPEEEGGSGPPYHGLVRVTYCNDVLVQGFEFVKPPSYFLEGSNGTNNMGSYDLTGEGVNKLVYRNCTQSNFFKEDGSLYAAGPMGTNFCKNIEFDNVMIGRFDAHCGVYNVTIKDSTVNKLNFIGAGEATVINTVVYVDGSNHDVVNMRDDYGSTWTGNITFNGVELRHSEDAKPTNPFAIFRVTWFNHNFGYTVHYADKITLTDVSIVRFSYGVDNNGNRWEVIDESTRNKEQVYVFTSPKASAGTHNSDLSGAFIGAQANLNPVVPTNAIVINNYKYKNNPVSFVFPTSPTFKNTSITVDGQKIQ